MNKFRLDIITWWRSLFIRNVYMYKIEFISIDCEPRYQYTGDKERAIDIASEAIKTFAYKNAKIYKIQISSFHEESEPSELIDNPFKIRSNVNGNGKKELINI